MRYGQRAKRFADALEKLGIAGLALGIFQSDWLGIVVGICSLAISLIITPKD